MIKLWLIIIQLVLYCVLFTLMVKFAVRHGAVDGLFFLSQVRAGKSI
jgi:hypothetical protein